MRTRPVALALAGLIAIVVTASPALALKDPFEPLVDPETQTEAETSTDGTTTVDEPAVSANENPFSEGMPQTGADTTSWLVLAYLLLVTGGALLVLAWTRRAAPVRRRVFRS